jgi:spore coat-associated protein N
MATSRKLLVPLATLVAAGAIAVGSGATFTSHTGNTISAVTAGTLTQSNSKDGGAIFGLTGIKPGDTVNGTLTLTNTGSLPARFTLTESGSSNAFTGSLLNLAITDLTTNTTVYDGTFGGLVDDQANALGTFAPGDSHQYRFTVHLAQAATNTEQGRSASASYAWDAIQLDGQTTDQ